MIKEKVYGSTKRFGARYGISLKKRFGAIEKVQRSKQKCPYCHAIRVKRISAGIWNCRKCGAKFTGRAYSLVKMEIEKGEESGPRAEVAKEGEEA